MPNDLFPVHPVAALLVLTTFEEDLAGLLVGGCLFYPTQRG